jgi:DsbC/DsbD-like thiol-disulfide interchange protein
MSFANNRLPAAGAALALCGMALLAGCSGGADRPSDAHPVVVTVETVPDAAVPGASVTLVWRFALADDWHLYWAGRNDSGFPPRIDLELPPGWLAGGLQWPVPERYVSAGDILDHVYFRELVLIQNIGVPKDAVPGGTVAVQADVQWLACHRMCVPGRTTLTLDLPVRTRAAEKESDSAALAAARLPEALPARTLETRWDGETFHLHGPGARQLTFMPTDDCGPLVDLLKDGEGGDRLALRFKPREGTLGPVRGLVTMESGGGETKTYRIDFPAVPLGTAPSGTTE